MYTLLKNKKVKKITKAELPALFTALVLTETIYRFGSFILECSTFMVTWFAVSFVLNNIFSSSVAIGKKRNAF